MKKLSFKPNTSAGYALCAALLPFILLLYLYQRNIQYLSLWQVLVFSGVIAVIFLFIYYFFKWLFKSELGAFVFCTVLFLSFFMFRSLSSVFFALLKLLRIDGEIQIPFALGARFFALFTLAAVIAFRIGKTERLQKMNGHIARISIGISGYYWNSRIKMPIATLAITILLFILLRLLFSIALKSLDPSIEQGPMMLFFCCAIILALALTYCCWKLKHKLSSRAVISATVVILAALLLQNVVSIAMIESRQQSGDAFHNESFIVEKELAQQPNIYWFHCDSMLGFDSMERLYGDDQKEFTDALESRGFWLGRESTLMTNRYTEVCIPALMSPYYYDRVQSWIYDPDYAEALPINSDLLSNPGARLTPSYTSDRNAREKNETVMAFNAAGYNTSTLSDLGIYFYPTVNQFYTGSRLLSPEISMPEVLSLTNEIDRLRSLIDLLNRISPLKFSDEFLFNVLTSRGFTAEEIEGRLDLFEHLALDDASMHGLNGYNRLADCLTDVATLPEPRFTVLFYYMAHSPFHYDEHGNFNPVDDYNPLLYPAQHKLAADTLIQYIDIILKSDPDAVIILQADHGIAAMGKEELYPLEDALKALHITEEDLPAVWNQVFSAVRLPKDKLTPQTQEILSDPRNISRYIINEYVGHNYEYIPPQFKQHT